MLKLLGIILKPDMAKDNVMALVVPQSDLQYSKSKSAFKMPLT